MRDNVQVAGPVAWRAGTPAGNGRVRHRGPALGLILLAQLLVVIDVSIVTLALPAIQRGLGFSPAGLQWVISAYALAFGGFLLLGGRLADLLGRRRILIAGAGFFTAASLACGLARSPGMLVAARAAEGLGAAMMAPAAMSLIMAIFPEGAERNRALGALGAVSGAGGAIGVLAGGMLTTWLSWPWIFFVNLPVGDADRGRCAAVAAGKPRQPGPPPVRRGRGGDHHRRPVGAGVRGGHRGQPRLGLGDHDRPAGRRGRAARRVRGDRGPVRGAAAAADVLPQPDRDGGEPGRAAARRADIPDVRVLVAVHAAGAGLLADQGRARVPGHRRRAHRLLRAGPGPSHQGGAKLVLTAGLLGLAVAQVLFARLPAAGHFTASLLPGFVVVAAALGLAFVGDVIASTAGVKPADAGLASGLINASQQIGGAIGLAVTTSVAAARTAALLHAGHPPAAALTGGFHDAFILTGVLALAAAIAAATLIRRTRS